MNTHTESASFFIDFNEKQYECVPVEKNGRMIYQIKFPNSYIYLTEAMARDGEKFWTAIPPDSKLNHIIPILGKQIANKKLKLTCATTTEEELQDKSTMN